MDLQEILAREEERRHEEGIFGIKACKESIRSTQKYTGKSLAELLKEYVHRANNDVFFNKAMVLACWELMEEEEDADA